MTGTERKWKRSAFPPGAAQGCPTAAPAALCGVPGGCLAGSVRGSGRALRGANWGYTCDGCGNFAKVLSRLPWLCVAGCRHRGTRSGHGDGCMIYRRTRRGLGLRREGVPNRARWCLRAAVRGGIGRGSGRRRTRSGMVPPGGRRWSRWRAAWGELGSARQSTVLRIFSQNRRPSARCQG